MLKATVSGSFRKHMPAVYRMVSMLEAEGVQVLSPADCRIVDEVGGFVFLASDPWRSIKMVEDRHLRAIVASDFLLVVCPDGYIGPSTAFEIGVANARGLPIYAETLPLDPDIACLVQAVPSVKELVRGHSYRKERITGDAAPAHALLDPDGAIERSLRALEGARKARGAHERAEAAAAARSVLDLSFQGMDADMMAEIDPGHEVAQAVGGPGR